MGSPQSDVLAIGGGIHGHGGLQDLEHCEFALVREALAESEMLLCSAPPVVWPHRFVMPHDPDMRPACRLHAGLFQRHHLRRREMLRAMDTGERGTTVRARCAGVDARRGAQQRPLRLRGAGGEAHAVTAGALVNATGPWAAQILSEQAYAPQRSGTSEVDDRCKQASRCFERTVRPCVVGWSCAVRPLLDDESGDASAVTGDAPLPRRKLSDRAGKAQHPDTDFLRFAQTGSLPAPLLQALLCQRQARGCGARVGKQLAQGMLGAEMAPGWFETELNCQHTHASACAAEDLPWRRTTHGLHLNAAERAAVAHRCAAHRPATRVDAGALPNEEKAWS